jgi:hypothetical protein
MTNDTPYWHKLISYWVRIKRRNGLTLPFIIGAEKFDKLSGDTAPMSVQELLSEIINSNTDDIVTLLYCDNIGDYVLGLNNSSNPMDGTKVINVQTKRVTLIATLGTKILGNTTADITAALTKKYSDCLTSKKYSLINFQWADFDEGDIKMINEALKNDN